MTFRIVVAYSIQVVNLLILLPFFLVVILPYTKVRRLILKKLHRKPHILWGPVPIINISHNRNVDRTMGYASDCLVYQTYHITQNSLFDYNLNIDKIFKLRIIGIIGLALPFLTMLWASFRYDIFHFFYCGGFLYTNAWLVKSEFILWKIIGKVVIVSAYGADIRLESVTRKLGKYNAYMDMTHKEIEKEIGQTEKQIQTRVNFILRWSTVSLSMGDMIEYTPGSKNDVFYWSIDTKDWQPVYETNNKEIVILHAPNHTHYKGTRFLLPVIERLKREGYPIKFILIQKMTNEQARKYYEQADIIAEQFIIGWHGFFAVEAMALGKPVLCYIRKKEYLPNWADCPIVNTPPEKIYENLLMLIKNRELRVEIGKKGRQYVEKVFSLQSVGERLDKIYKDIF